MLGNAEGKDLLELDGKHYIPTYLRVTWEKQHRRDPVREAVSHHLARTSVFLHAFIALVSITLLAQGSTKGFTWLAVGGTALGSVFFTVINLALIIKHLGGWAVYPKFLKLFRTAHTFWLNDYPEDVGKWGAAELRERSREALVELAQGIIEAENMGALQHAESIRSNFRSCHSAFHGLGLVEGDWTVHFQKAQDKISSLKNGNLVTNPTNQGGGVVVEDDITARQ